MEVGAPPKTDNLRLRVHLILANRRSANPFGGRLSHFDDRLTYSLCRAPWTVAAISLLVVAFRRRDVPS